MCPTNRRNRQQVFFQRRGTTRLVATPSILPRGSFATFCGPAQRKQSAIRRSSPSKNLIRGIEERLARDDERLSAQVYERCKSRVQFLLRGSVEDMELNPQRVRCRLRFLRFNLRGWIDGLTR
jgi:hypothetical protein